MMVAIVIGAAILVICAAVVTVAAYQTFKREARIKGQELKLKEQRKRK